MVDNKQTTSQISVPAMSAPQDGLTRGAQISTGLNFCKGLDRLKFGFSVEFTDTTVLDLLAEMKAKAQEKHESILFNFGLDYDFLIHPNGRKGGYNFHISKGDVNVFISTRTDYMQTPNVWIDIGSASCWFPGYRAVVLSLMALIRREWKGLIHKNTVSEVHLCVDAVGVDLQTLEIQNFNRWITRANDFNCYYTRGVFTGATLTQFGEDFPFQSATIPIRDTGVVFGQGDLVLRIYDKVTEIKLNGAKQSLFASVWGKEEYNDCPVTRVEFQLRKPVLRQFRIKTLQDLFQKMSGLWEYLTQDWARLTCTDIDRENRHQDRAKIHPFWQEIQEVDWNTTTPVMRKKPLSLKDSTQLIEQGFGCLLNAAIIDGCLSSDPYDIMQHCRKILSDHLDALDKDKDRDGESVLQRKFDQKFSEVWPYGEISLVPGPNSFDAETGFICASPALLKPYETNPDLETEFA